MTKMRKLVLLTALYLAQGLPFGFFTQALPVLLRNSGLSLPAIGFANLLTLPWALKFLWAPSVDRWHLEGVGLRRSWLLPLQAASVLLFALLSLLTPQENLELILAAFLLTNLLAAAQDVATDGLAVDSLTANERGWANGIQVAGYRLGMIIGGGALLFVYDYINWGGVMLTMALIAFACTLPVWFFREPARPLRDKAQSAREALNEVMHLIRKPGAAGWAIVLLVYKTGHASATAMLRPWLVDRGYSMSDIAWILGGFGFVAGLAGALTGGLLASRFSRRKLLILFGIVESFAVTTYLWPVWSEHATYKVAIATSFDHFASGMATAVLFTMMMDACSKERAASDYTFQACLVVIAGGLASAFSGVSADKLGYQLHFLIAAFLSLAGVALTAIVIKRPATAALLDPKLD